MNLEDDGNFEFYNEKLWTATQSFGDNEIASINHLQMTINSLSCFDDSNYKIDINVWSDNVLRLSIFPSEKYDKYGEPYLFDDEPDFIRVSVRKYRRRGLTSLFNKQKYSFYDVKFKTNACASKYSFDGGTYVSDDINETSTQILKVVKYIFSYMSMGKLTKPQCKKINQVSDIDFNYY